MTNTKHLDGMTVDELKARIVTLEDPRSDRLYVDKHRLDWLCGLITHYGIGGLENIPWTVYDEDGKSLMLRDTVNEAEVDEIKFDREAIDAVMKSSNNQPTTPTCSTQPTFPHFHSGNEKQDVICLLDMAIDIVEIWDVKNSAYNQELKRCWMKRAQELGAIVSW